MSHRQKKDRIRITDEGAKVMKIPCKTISNAETIHDLLKDVKNGKVEITNVFLPDGTLDLCVVYRSVK